MIAYSNGIFWKLRISVQYKSMTAYGNGIFLRNIFIIFFKQNKQKFFSKFY